MATDLSVLYGYKTKPSALLNSIFSSTVNTAAKTLVRVSTTDHPGKWRVKDHLRFIHMVMTWLTVWVLRILMDYFPSIGPSHASPYLLEGFSTVGSLDLATYSSTSCSSVGSLDIVPYEGSEVLPVKALGRALSHILALLNELPAASRKYPFTVSMADKIVDENTRSGHVELLNINRAALSSAFTRTLSLLYCSLHSGQKADNSDGWTTRLIGAIPLGSYLAPVLFKGLGMIFPLGSSIIGGWGMQKQKQAGMGGERVDDVAAEKHAQELLWITNKMRSCGAVDEALVQWSLASGLASLALTTNPRVQGVILKISAILFGDVNGPDIEVPRQVKFRLLVLWLPVFIYADNGLSYPVLSGYEMAEIERVMDALIASLPAMDQEVVLSNWFQDFITSNSDWPNLQISYDRWCHSARKLIA